MAIIVILIAISLSIAILFLAIFYWNMKSGQYDDTYTPSVRILFEHKTMMEKEKTGKKEAINLPGAQNQTAHGLADAVRK